MQPSFDLAARLLRFEQQLQAYQKLHGEELAELWRALNACKRELAASVPDQPANGSVPAKLAGDEGDPQEETDKET